MVLLFGVVVAVLIGLLRGGELKNFGRIRLQWAWLALIALTIQALLLRGLPDWDILARLLFPLTHAAIVAVAWANRDLRGMRLLAVAVTLNLMVMVLNGGFMPMPPEVLVQAGVADSVESVPLYTRVGHSKGLVLPRDEIVLWWFSDIIALRPIRTVVSVGDILMVPGIFLFVEGVMLHRKEW